MNCPSLRYIESGSVSTTRDSETDRRSVIIKKILDPWIVGLIYGAGRGTSQLCSTVRAVEIGEVAHRCWCRLSTGPAGALSSTRAYAHPQTLLNGPVRCILHWRPSRPLACMERTRRGTLRRTLKASAFCAFDRRNHPSCTLPRGWPLRSSCRAIAAGSSQAVRRGLLGEPSMKRLQDLPCP